jgi:hypothetical protein
MQELRSRLAAFPVQAHDQAVSKSVEQKPEIIPGRTVSRPQFNEPLANESLALWIFRAKASGPKDLRCKIRLLNRIERADENDIVAPFFLVSKFQTLLGSSRTRIRVSAAPSHGKFQTY